MKGCSLIRGVHYERFHCTSILTFLISLRSPVAMVDFYDSVAAPNPQCAYSYLCKEQHRSLYVERSSSAVECWTLNRESLASNHLAPVSKFGLFPFSARRPSWVSRESPKSKCIKYTIFDSGKEINKVKVWLDDLQMFFGIF